MTVGEWEQTGICNDTGDAGVIMMLLGLGLAKIQHLGQSIFDSCLS